MRKLPLPAFLLIALTLLNSCRKDDIPHTAAYIPPPPSEQSLVPVPAYYGLYVVEDSVFAPDSITQWRFDHRQTIALNGASVGDSTFYVSIGTNWLLGDYFNSTWMAGGYWTISAGGNFADRRSVTFSDLPTGYDAQTHGPTVLSVAGTMKLYNDTTWYTEYNENNTWYHRIHSRHKQ